MKQDKMKNIFNMKYKIKKSPKIRPVSPGYERKGEKKVEQG